MRLVGTERKLDLDDDPKPLDRAAFKRLELMVMHEACHPAWGCALYRLHRLKRIDNDEREAGDRYWKVIDDHKRQQQIDPDDFEPKQRELVLRRINKAKNHYRDVVGILGFGRNILDKVVFREEWPSSEREHLVIKQCLIILKNYFMLGTKQVRNL